jgi:hypothetical protein
VTPAIWFVGAPIAFALWTFICVVIGKVDDFWGMTEYPEVFFASVLWPVTVPAVLIVLGAVKGGLIVRRSLEKAEDRRRIREKQERVELLEVEKALAQLEAGLNG